MQNFTENVEDISESEKEKEKFIQINLNEPGQAEEKNVFKDSKDEEDEVVFSKEDDDGEGSEIKSINDS